MVARLYKRFVEYAIKYFAFLKTVYGMDLVETAHKECVRYQSCLSWIEIWYDRFSIHIDIGIMNSSLKESLWIIKFYKTGEAKSVHYMASTEEALEKGVKKLANFVRLYCDEALKGDIAFYKKVHRFWDNVTAKYDLENKVKDIELQAKEAWGEKDYMTVVELYSSLLPNLSKVQKKRLSICYRHLTKE